MDSTNLIIALFVAITLSIVVLVVFYQNKNFVARLTRQAEKRGGEIRKGSFFKMTELRIPLKDVVIVIQTVPGSKHSPPKTIAQVKLDSPRLTAVRILRNDLWQKTLTAFGKERSPTGDEEFDSQWVVQTEDPFIVQKLVTADLKARLSERSLRSLDVRIQPQEASFTITAIPSNDEGYDNFIDAVFFILEKTL